MTDGASTIEPFLRAARDHSPRAELLVVPEWDETAWRELFSYAQPVPIARGELLIQRGDTGRALFFVTSGSLDIVRSIGDSSLGSVAAVLPGSVVGELGFFDGKPRTAKVWATADSMLLRLDEDGYRRYLQAHPVRAAELMFALGRLMSQRLRRTMMQASR
jgi:CRP-like cAMP-binding protein